MEEQKGRPPGSQAPPAQGTAPTNVEQQMQPRPVYRDPRYKPAGKLVGKVALVTGADSGIGRAVAVAYALEGADVAVVFLKECADAQETERLVKAEGRRCILIGGDVGDPAFCRDAVARTVKELGRLDILVNNAGEQHVKQEPEQITPEQLQRTFATNIFSMFYLSQAALAHLPADGVIINTTSVTAYRGSEHLLDYSSTKAAIVGFTRSLAKMVAGRGIRVNGVAPGPIWTPLITSTFDPEHVKTFGKDTLLGRPGEPGEVAPCYVFLASTDSSYMTGQVLHPNGGEIVNA